MMHPEAGVRTVSVGGRPTPGPMQAPAGNRGARSYSVNALDIDIYIAEEIDNTTSMLLPNRTQDVLITYASINLRDQIRKGQDVPLQFVYEAADCRIFFTPQTVLNLTNLWNYAASAIWNDSSLCVQGSTGYATTGLTTDTTGPPPGSIANGTDLLRNMTGIVKLSGVTLGINASFNSQLPDSQSFQAAAGQKCTVKGNGGCMGYNTCEPQPACNVKPDPLFCLPACSSVNNYCNCVRTTPYSTKGQSGIIYWEGYCRPPQPDCNKKTSNKKALSGSLPPNANKV